MINSKLDDYNKLVLGLVTRKVTDTKTEMEFDYCDHCPQSGPRHIKKPINVDYQKVDGEWERVRGLCAMCEAN